MDVTLEIFRANLERVHSIHGLYLDMVQRVTAIIDLSDLLRTELVLTMSALDHFVHELSRIGMMEIWRGTRPTTPAYLRFSVALGTTAQLSEPKATDGHLDTEIRERHSFLTFQRPDKIADAIRLFSSLDIWSAVSKELNEDAKQIKARLELIVERRNKIAHEADIDPSYPGQRWPITPQDTENAVAFVKRIGEAIHKLVK